GWIKYGQRWYNPTTGRFTSQDAHSFLADPAQGNRYAYAGDDPINNTDPTGNESLSEYGLSCLKGGAQSAVVGLYTGASETGYGAVGAFAGGCATNVGLDILEEYGGEQGSGAAGAIDFLGNVKDVVDVAKSFL
ncbi:RHS repeat-associated core domain-containing protein, partial [Streptomyces sp. NPDC088197]|uniref:RHS repeat-associated core domain-containing protein n=1 Tax=Streptomyces sp. NPDC088197 TaxID=3365840 RepID=UPI0037F5FB44